MSGQQERFTQLAAPPSRARNVAAGAPRQHSVLTPTASGTRWQQQLLHGSVSLSQQGSDCEARALRGSMRRPSPATNAPTARRCV